MLPGTTNPCYLSDQKQRICRESAGKNRDFRLSGMNREISPDDRSLENPNLAAPASTSGRVIGKVDAGFPLEDTLN